MEEIEKTDPDIVVRHYSTLQKIAVDNSRPIRRDGIEVRCYWGKSRAGKTHRAFEEAGDDVYIKNPNTKWWDGYRGESNVIIDEFTGLVNISYLLSWFDKYPCNVEVKGSQRSLRATKFWITSNLPPKDWFPQATESQLEALMNRFTIIEEFKNVFQEA